MREDNNLDRNNLTRCTVYNIKSDVVSFFIVTSSVDQNMEVKRNRYHNKFKLNIWLRSDLKFTQAL